jgi:protein-disulfide isomerase
MEATTGGSSANDSLNPLAPPAVPLPPPPPPRRPRRWVILTFFLVVGFIILLGLINRQINKEPDISDSTKFSTAGQAVEPVTVDKTLLIRDSEHSLGSAEATVEIIEFADFQCPYCLEAFPIIRSLTIEYGDRIHYVYRHFPLMSIHDRAMAAAEASECAREQGKFWPYHDRLFQFQQAMSDQDFRVHAEAVGLDVASFDSCLNDHRYKGMIERDLQDGRALGVSGTPTWFINGERVEGVIPADNFRAGLEKILNNK